MPSSGGRTCTGITRQVPDYAAKPKQSWSSPTEKSGQITSYCPAHELLRKDLM